MLLVEILGLSFLFWSAAADCDGYDVQFRSIKPCNEDDDNVIEIHPDSSVSFEDCIAIPEVCMKWESFDKADVSYIINRESGKSGSSKPLKGSFDMCDENHPSNVKSVFNALGLPSTCPVEGGEECINGDKQFDMSKQKIVMGMLKGNATITIKVNHGEVGKSCFVVHVEVNKV